MTDHPVACVVCRKDFVEFAANGGRYYVCSDCRITEQEKEDAVAQGQIPEFKDFAEMQKWLDEQNNTGTTKIEKPKSKKKSTKNKPPKLSEPVAERENPDLIWQVHHFYMRKLDSLIQVTKDARFEKTRVNENNTIIFVHAHPYTYPCTEHCREI